MQVMERVEVAEVDRDNGNGEKGGSTVLSFAGVGLLQTAFGAGLLVWAGTHYDDLHGPLRANADVVHPHAARVVGLVTVTAIGLALATAVAVAFTR